VYPIIADALCQADGQFSMLMSLNRPNPPGMGAVASLLAMDRTTLTAALKPLERRRLIALLRLVQIRTTGGVACWH
jgi:DNA-binding MarR family transcriptional regulator